MSAKVTLTVTEGKPKGEQFSFDFRDYFLLTGFFSRNFEDSKNRMMELLIKSVVLFEKEILSFLNL